MKETYIIWHDNDYDFALWVYKNTDLSLKEVILRKIPKTNESNLLARELSDDLDFFILPYIKFATPDILIQKIEDNKSKMIAVTEFMTHTPHHDHIFQRFERIYCNSKFKIPTALVLAEKKTKIEKGTRKEYKKVIYSPNALTMHVYIKTFIMEKNPTLVFFWPDKDGFLKYDKEHPTAPKIEGDIKKWLNFINEALKEEDCEEFIKKDSIKQQQQKLIDKYRFPDNKKFTDYDYYYILNNIKSLYPKLERVKVVKTKDAINEYKIDVKKISGDFKKRKLTVIFEYNSATFRTDPYCGFLCGVYNLFCFDNDGKRQTNLIHKPNKIYFKEGDKNKFKEIDDNEKKCLIDKKIKNIDEVFNIKKHLIDGCVFTQSKQRRVFSTIADMILFEDEIYYNDYKKYDN